MRFNSQILLEWQIRSQRITSALKICVFFSWDTFRQFGRNEEIQMFSDCNLASSVHLKQSTTPQNS